VEPVNYESVSVLFTDFKGFTQLSEQLTPKELVDELDYCFSYFDEIIEKHNLEKLKTIGDSYMAAGGIPTLNTTHAIDTVLAALEIQAFMQQRQEQKMRNNSPYWEIRIGIHSGPLMAGVIGQKKFAYDVWGDTVNTASRMESSGVPGKINISQSTFELIKNYFECDYRGKLPAKNKGELDMYLVKGIKQHFLASTLDSFPNTAEFNYLTSARKYAEYCYAS
jgi:class 3 adenylate cyclase